MAKTNEQMVVNFITENPSATKATITEATGIKGLELHNLLKRLCTAGTLKVSGEGKDAEYSTADEVEEVEDGEDVEAVEGEGSAEQENVEEAEETGQQEETEETDERETAPKQKSSTKSKVLRTSTRTERFSFNGEDGLSKGALAKRIVAKYVADNKGITYKQLKEVFPDELLKRFGLFQDVDKAREISGPKYDRYAFKAEDIIKLKDKQIVVCNQWTSDNIQPLLAKAEELGYKIK